MKKITVLAMMAVLTTGVLTGCGASGTAAGGKDIGRDTALETALNDAQVKEADTTRLKVSEDREDGQKVYEIRFDAAGVEYDYEVAASDGQILNVEREEIVSGNTDGAGNTDQTGSVDDAGQANENTSGSTGNANVKISKEEAVKVALERVPGATEKDIRIEFDEDDGQYRYEGDIIYDQKEYDFEIDANSGTILEWSEERR